MSIFAARGAITASRRRTVSNYLTNADFELDSNADGLCDDWIDEHSTAVMPTYTRVASISTGTYAQRMYYHGDVADDATKKIEIYQATPFGSVAGLNGKTATFSIWVKGSFVGTYGFVGIEAFLSDHSYISETDLVFTPTGTAQLVTVNYTLPAGCDYVAVYIQVPEMYPSSVCDLTIDNASLTIA